MAAVGGTELQGGPCVSLRVPLLPASPFPLLWPAGLSLSHPYVLLISLVYKEYNTLQTCLDNRDKKIAHLIKKLSQESLRAPAWSSVTP